MARTSLGLCGLGLLAAGCVSTQKLAEQPEPRPKNENIFLEETVHNDSVDYRVSLKRNEKPHATVFVKDGIDKTTVEFGKRGPFDLMGWKGNGEIIGFTDSNHNNGVGLNARGNVGKTKLGVALERKRVNDQETEMCMAYLGRKFSNLGVKLGIVNTNGDKKGIATLDYTAGQNMFGAGITTNGEEGFATAMLGRFFRKRGKGLGYRIWGKYDFNGNYLVDILGSTNTTISKFPIGAITEVDNGLHDPKIFTNLFDAHSYLWQNTSPGGIVGNMKFLSIGGSTTTSADFLYQFPEREGISPRLGLGYRVTDTGTERTDSVTGTIGTSLIDSFGNGGYVDLKVTDTRGDKTHSVIVGAQFKF